MSTECAPDTHDEPDEEGDSGVPRGPVILVVLGVATALVLTGLLVTSRYGDPTKAGEFGDMFGVANALFSGLAFAGVIFAILLQRKELQLQRRELKASRIQLSLQREELAATREEMELARTEAKRSADAQERTVRLSALTQLILFKKEEVQNARESHSGMQQSLAQGMRTGWNSPERMSEVDQQIRRGDLEIDRYMKELRELHGAAGAG